MQQQIDFTLGLLMADGSFQINHWKKKYLQYRIIIKFKNVPENIKMLQDLRSHFKIGTININQHNVLWAINHKKDVTYFLTLIKNHPLLHLKTKTHTTILKMIYALDHKMSYNEYQFLKEKENQGQWLWPCNKDFMHCTSVCVCV